MNIRFETLNAASFLNYGSVIPAGTPHDHLMDAQIFQSCYNKMRSKPTRPLATPRLRIIHSDPWQFPFELPKLYKNLSERVVFASVSQSQHLICVAKDRNGEPYQPHAFLMGSGLAVNILAGVWYSQLQPLNMHASHAVIDSKKTDGLLTAYKFSRPVQVTGISSAAA